MRKALPLAFAFLLLAGCVGLTEGGDAYRDLMRNQLSDRMLLYDEAQVDICNDVECWTMTCTNSSSWFGLRSSYAGGSCRMESLAGENPSTDAAERYEVSQERFSNLANGSVENTEIRQFMIGAGPLFYDFGEANRWCNNQLKMAVHWLAGTPETGYPTVDGMQAVCLLYEEVMPVYVLYRGGEPDVDSAGEIANSLYNGRRFMSGGNLDEGPVGPVIITTEMDADLADPATLDLVKQQATEIKRRCPNGPDGEIYCFVALGAKMNDFEGVEAVLSDPIAAEDIDLVAFGMNTHRATTCDYNEMFLDAQNFSSFSWYTHGKPTVIPYMLFDNGWEVVDETGNYVCNWTEGEMMSGFNAFFSNIPAFVETGIIGAAPYDFNSSYTGARNNPLGCLDCSIGTSEDRMQSWFAGCQGFTGIYRLDQDECAGPCNVEDPPECCGGSFTSTPGIPLVFPNDTGGRCNFGDQWDAILHMQYGAGAFRDFGTPVASELREPMEPLVSCAACMNENVEWPWPSLTLSGGGRGGLGADSAGAQHEYLEGMTNLEAACSGFPELDSWASRRGLDPMYVRAIAWTESGFDPCSAACVCSAGSGCSPAGFHCFPSGHSVASASGKGYNIMEDPENACGPYPSDTTDPAATADYAWYGLGLMGHMTSPYIFWPEEYCEGADGCGRYSEYYLGQPGGVRSGDIAPTASAECGNDFNPFNASDAACLGTYIISENLRFAENVVDLNRDLNEVHDLFNLEDNADKERVLEYYIASHRYAGTWKSSWLSDFAERRKWTVARCSVDGAEHLAGCTGYGELNEEECYGYTDFVEFVRDCAMEGAEANPGDNKMGFYIYFNNNCPNAACPSWRTLQRLSDEETTAADDFGVPECGNPYVCGDRSEEEGGDTED